MSCHKWHSNYAGIKLHQPPPLPSFFQVKLAPSFREGNSSESHFWSQLCRESPRSAPLSSVICYKNSTEFRNAVILIVMVYYTEKIQIKSAEVSGAQDRVQQTHSTEFPLLSSSAVIQTVLYSPSHSVWHMYRTLPVRDLHQALMFRGVLGGWSCTYGVLGGWH